MSYTGKPQEAELPGSLSAPPQPGGDGATSFGATDFPMVEAPEAEAPGTDEPEDREPSLSDFMLSVIDLNASDLHLTAGLPPMVRVNGVLKPIRGYRKLFPQDMQELIYAILTQKQREIF